MNFELVLIGLILFLLGFLICALYKNVTSFGRLRSVNYIVREGQYLVIPMGSRFESFNEDGSSDGHYCFLYDYEQDKLIHHKMP